MKVKKTKDTKAKKKTKGSKSEEPMVKVIKLHVQPENPRNGFFELDWNDEFVNMLKQNGYQNKKLENCVQRILLYVHLDHQQFLGPAQDSGVIFYITIYSVALSLQTK